MKKILYITNGINGSGGLERVLSIKTAVLAEQYGYEVHILVLNQPEKKTFFPFAPSISIHSIIAAGNPIQYYQQYKSGLNHVVQEVRPDIISVCDDGLKGFFVPSLIRYKCPVIYERHASALIDAGAGTLSKIKNKLIYRLMQSRIRSFDRFVILTEGNRREWTGSNVRVIPNPIAAYPESVADLDARIVIAVGSQSYNKGYDRLLKVWQSVVASYPGWRLQIFGKKNPGLLLEALADELGISGSVTFNDPVIDIQQRYLDASVMVLTSRSEGFGMVLIEAMACGLPCVSFDCPHGPRDIITSEHDGFLIPDGEIELFAEKVEMLIADIGLRKSMGYNAVETAQQYAPERIVARWDNLFQELILKK